MSRTVQRPSLTTGKGDEQHYISSQHQHSQQQDFNNGSEDSDEESSGSAEVEDCPLCLEEMDESDVRFIPCPCGYQICRFCWHKIREEGNEKCPACRRAYDDADVQFLPEPATPAVKQKSKSKKTASPKADKNAAPSKKIAVALQGGKGSGRKSLGEFRVIQRNLVYVIGISARIAHENILKEPEFFGQYGKIIKIVVNRRNLAMGSEERAESRVVSGNGGMTSCSTSGPSASAYVTYVRKEDAEKAIAGVDGSVFDGRVLRATYGTTKYCSFYLRGMQCTNAGCMYLHEEGECVDSFTKDELAAGKLHLHSYVLDKSEAVGLKQFGVLNKPVAATPSRPVAKPSTPVLQQAPATLVQPVFTDRTPSAFFERLSRLAAPHDHVESTSVAAEVEAPPGLASTSPIPVVLPPRRSNLFVFDPFRPPEEHLSPPPAPPAASTPSPPVRRPAPIGSPISAARQPHRVVSFSESLGAPPATGAARPVERSVEHFFSLFNTAGTVPSGKPAEEAPPLAALAFDPMQSIFEDPAIVQARKANAHQRLVRTAPAPASMPPASPVPASAVPSAPVPTPQQHQFTTVSSGAKSSSGTPIGKKQAPPSKGPKQTPSISTVTSPPPQTASQNAFMALLNHSAFSADASFGAVASATGSQAGTGQATAQPAKKGKTLKKGTTASPNLAALDSAILASSSQHNPAAVETQPPHATETTTTSTSPLPPGYQPYQRATDIPMARRSSPSLMGPFVMPSECSTTDQQIQAISGHLAALEAERRAQTANALQIEAFMRDLVRRSWPKSPQ